MVLPPSTSRAETRWFLPHHHANSGSAAATDTRPGPGRDSALLPIILILLLGAIDFGRLFFDWINLQQAVRVGANFAATHPNLDTVAEERDRYEELIVGDLVDRCEADPMPNPTYTTSDERRWRIRASATSPA